MRIVSLVPAATEIAFALGLGDALVGVSAECDWPPEARDRKVIVRSATSFSGYLPGEIDRAVSLGSSSGEPRYLVDEDALRALAPDLVLAQTLCNVCALSGADVTAELESLTPAPAVLWFAPRTIAEIIDNIRVLGAATDRALEAAALIEDMNRRLRSVTAAVATLRRPRVAFIEWTDPLYCAGHWIPEMIELAGGDDLLGRKGSHSIPIDWSDLIAAGPEVIIVGPCGYSLAEAREQARALSERAEWRGLPAVQNHAVYPVDANAYFARPGPRVVDGIELLVRLIHGG